ncbi:MAG: hypothetical protein ACI8WY_002797, partial [Planctomycetota bacterium]
GGLGASLPCPGHVHGDRAKGHARSAEEGAA